MACGTWKMMHVLTVDGWVFTPSSYCVVKLIGVANQDCQDCHLPDCRRSPGLPIAKVVTSRCTKGRVCDCFATLPRLSRLPVARIQFRGDAQGGALESQIVLTALPDLHRFCPKQLGRRPAWWAGARSALNSLTGPHTHTAQTGPPECGLVVGITPPALLPH